MNILITSAGQRVSLVRAFQNELTKLYPDGQIITIDMNPELSPACQVADHFVKVKRATHPSYISDILKVCLEHDVKMIVPTIDTELQVLADYKKLFAAHDIHLIVSSADFVRKCRDKRKINQFFKENGIPIPKPVNKYKPTFPLFIKPYDGSLSADTFLINGPEELTDYHMNNKKLLFMEYISKEDHDEYTVDMYYGRDHKVKCIVPRKRITIRAGEINKGKTCYNSIIPFLKERLGYIEGAVGCQTMQLFLNRHNGNITAIEINPRFGGGYPLSYLAGANYPAYLIREYYMGEQLEYFDSWERNLLMLRYDAEILVHEKVPELVYS